MPQPPKELVGAMVVILVTSTAYGYASRNGVPRPGGAIGLTLGIVGFLLMLATEVLYSLRKRLSGFTRGPMSAWLRIHVFTGLVGAWLVLLHSSGKFHGLAGIVAGLTILIVASGFVGRYIYTAVPRGLDGVAAAAAATELRRQIATLEDELKRDGFDFTTTFDRKPPRGWWAVLARPLLRWRQRRRVRRALRTLKRIRGVEGARLRGLLARRYELWLQVHSLAATRRLLALWHLFHIPLALSLFALAFIHIAGALYYATFWK